MIVMILIPFLSEAALNSVAKKNLQHSLKATIDLAALHRELVLVKANDVTVRGGHVQN